mmetsp:Transcript_86423/g.245016  ORF Transcript_86423/g.245016 Transcript_86423/m.245016 type:complete len:478 (+) Transcript_86423:672-2105(+)
MRGRLDADEPATPQARGLGVRGEPRGHPDLAAALVLSVEGLLVIVEERVLGGLEGLGFVWEFNVRDPEEVVVRLGVVVVDGDPDARPLPHAEAVPVDPRGLHQRIADGGLVRGPEQPPIQLLRHGQGLVVLGRVQLAPAPVEKADLHKLVDPSGGYGGDAGVLRPVRQLAGLRHDGHRAPDPLLGHGQLPARGEDAAQRPHDREYDELRVLPRRQVLVRRVQVIADVVPAVLRDGASQVAEGGHDVLNCHALQGKALGFLCVLLEDRRHAPHVEKRIFRVEPHRWIHEALEAQPLHAGVRHGVQDVLPPGVDHRLALPGHGGGPVSDLQVQQPGPRALQHEVLHHQQVQLPQVLPVRPPDLEAAQGAPVPDHVVQEVPPRRALQVLGRLVELELVGGTAQVLAEAFVAQPAVSALLDEPVEGRGASGRADQRRGLLELAIAFNLCQKLLQRIPLGAVRAAGLPAVAETLRGAHRGKG